MDRGRHTLIVLGLVAMALAWQVPAHYKPWTTFQQQWLAALGAALIALGAILGGRSWYWPRPALVVAATALVPVAQGLAGQVVFLSDWLLAALYLMGFAQCVAAGHQLADHERERWLDSLMWALLAGAAASAAIGIAQWLQVGLPYVPIEPLEPGARVFANLRQPNHLATLQCIGLCAALYHYERRTITGPTAALLVAVMAWTLVMTQSRVGWVFAVVLAAWWWARRVGLRLSARAVVVGLLAFVCCTALWPALNDLLFAGSVTGIDERTSGGTRPANWLAFIEASQIKPWLGWGWTQVSLAQMAIAVERPITPEVLHNTHNVFLDLVIWAGWPAAVVLSGLALWWLGRQVKACRSQDSWATLLAIAAITIHALTEFPLDFTYFLFPLGLLVGTLHGRGPPAPPPTGGRWPALAAWLVSVGMLFWIAVEYLEVETSARNVRLLMAGVGVDTVPHVPPPHVRLLDAPREYHRLLNTPARPDMTAEQLDWMRSVTLRNHFPPALLRYALAAGLNGRPDESARMLSAICHINPPARCLEGRDAWHAAVQRWPKLAEVVIPPEMQ